MYNVDKGPYGPETKKTLTHKMTNNKPIESLQCSKNVGVFYLEEVEAEVKLDQVVHPPRNKCSDKRIKVPIFMTQRLTYQLMTEVRLQREVTLPIYITMTNSIFLTERGTTEYSLCNIHGAPTNSNWSAILINGLYALHKAIANCCNAKQTG